jgi:hypothetical protein
VAETTAGAPPDIEEDTMRKRHARPAPQVDVVLDGTFLGIDEYARRKVTAVLRLAHEPVRSATVRLTRLADADGPVDARATLGVAGRPVHVGVTAATAREAVDLMVPKLRTALERHTRHREPRRDRVPVPAEDREVVARRSPAAPRMTIDEAAAELDRSGDGFLLFTSAGDGRDLLLFHGDASRYRLERPHQRLTVDQALARLDVLGVPFVFFTDADRGRGEVVHRRRDGAYGLVLPPG